MTCCKCRFLLKSICVKRRGEENCILWRNVLGQAYLKIRYTSTNLPHAAYKNKNKPTNPPPPPPSQGAQIVHLSTALLGTFPQISAVVLFGDPDEGKAISCLTPAANSADVLTICHDGDLICDGQPIVLPAHLTYGLDGIKAAGFVAGGFSFREKERERERKGGGEFCCLEMVVSLV